ncbi:MAG: hypothetical protein FWE20_01190 [Defluviitaleaceae bacterium]|nr:hypothetical protein [Defluviitaleaceae bacterium]
MKEIVVRKLTFDAFVKLYCLYGIAIPLPLLLIMFIPLLVTQPSSVLVWIGVTILFGLLYAFFGVLAYWPFEMILRAFKDLRFMAIIEDVYEPAGTQAGIIKIAVNRLSFGSHMKFFLMAGIIGGLLTQIVMIIVTALNIPFYLNMGTIIVHGNNTPASLFAGLLFTCLLYVFLAIWGYIPYRLILKIFKGIRFTALIDAEEQAIEFKWVDLAEIGEIEAQERELSQQELNQGDPNKTLGCG